MTPSCIAAMNRGGSPVMRKHVARAAVSLVVQLDDPRPPRRHEPVLGRDEEGVQQDQNCDADEFKKESHAPTPDGAQVLGGMSSTSYLAV